MQNVVTRRQNALVTHHEKGGNRRKINITVTCIHHENKTKKGQHEQCEQSKFDRKK